MTIVQKIKSFFKKVIITVVTMIVVGYAIAFAIEFYKERQYRAIAEKQRAIEERRRDVDTVLTIVNAELDGAPEIRKSRKYVDRKNSKRDVSLRDDKKSRRDRIAELLYNYGNDLLLNGDSADHKRHEGMELLDQSGGFGFAPAWSELGFLHEEKGFSSGDFSRSVAYLKAAAEMGDPEAMGGLVEIYWLGLGVPQNRSRAVELAKIAIETRRAAGVLDSYYFGLAYLNGEGDLPVDLKKALKLFTKGAEAEVWCAYPGVVPDKRVLIFYQLGRIYMDGIGVPIDVNEARYWFEKCCNAKGRSDQPDWKTAMQQATKEKKAIEDEIERSFRADVIKDEVVYEARKVAAFLKKNPTTDLKIDAILESEVSDAEIKAIDVTMGYEISISRSGTTAELRIKQIGDLKIPPRSNKISFVRKDDCWESVNVLSFLKRMHLAIRTQHRANAKN